MLNHKFSVYDIVSYWNILSVSVLITLGFVLFPLKLEAHNGQTDQYGCHYSSEYHCH